MKTNKTSYRSYELRKTSWTTGNPAQAVYEIFDGDKCIISYKSHMTIDQAKEYIDLVLFVGGMKMKTKLKAPFKPDVIKRCYFPGIVIDINCPNCGDKMTMDFGHNYIQYKETGENLIWFDCEKCNNAYSLKVNISMEATFEFSPDDLKRG